MRETGVAQRSVSQPCSPEVAGSNSDWVRKGVQCKTKPNVSYELTLFHRDESLGLWASLTTVFTFYLHFTQQPNFFRTGLFFHSWLMQVKNKTGARDADEEKQWRVLRCMDLPACCAVDRARPRSRLAQPWFRLSPSTIMLRSYSSTLRRKDAAAVGKILCCIFTGRKGSFNCSCFSYRYHEHPTLPSTKAPPKQAGWVTYLTPKISPLVFVYIYIKKTKHVYVFVATSISAARSPEAARTSFN